MSGKKTMSRKYGNGQTIGSNVYQNTYFMTKQAGDSLLAVLAESAIDSVTGAYASILACEAVAKGFSFAEEPEGELERQFARASGILNERIYKGRNPRISLLAACFRSNAVSYKRVGDMKLASFNGSELWAPELEFGRLEMKKGSMLLCNQGLWQALNEMEVTALMAGKAHPYKKAQKIIEAVNCKNLKDQKSTVLVIVT